MRVGAEVKVWGTGCVVVDTGMGSQTVVIAILCTCGRDVCYADGGDVGCGRKVGVMVARLQEVLNPTGRWLRLVGVAVAAAEGIGLVVSGEGREAGLAIRQLLDAVPDVCWALRRGWGRGGSVSAGDSGVAQNEASTTVSCCRIQMP